MTLNAAEFPILVPVNGDGYERPPPAKPIVPRPVSACVLTKLCKPLEVECLDLSQAEDCMTLAAMTESVHSDQLSMLIWPQNTEPPLVTAYNLLLRMVTRHEVTPLTDTVFMQAWIKDARIALADYDDLKELISDKQSLSEIDEESDNG